MTCQERGRCGEFHAKLSLQRVRRRTVTEYLRLGFPEGHTNLADCLHAASGGISQGGRGVYPSMGGVADGKALHVESFAQIGRASCRERVCQYFSIALVAGSLKKNIYFKTM